MRSPADDTRTRPGAVAGRRGIDARSALEWVCRIAAVALLAWALLAAVRRVSSAPATTLASSLAAPLDTATEYSRLEGWSRDPELARVHLSLEAVPGAATRDWLRALDAAGTRVTWAGEIPATAIAVEPLADPHGGLRIAVAAPAGAGVVVEDAVGRIDSVEARAGGASVWSSSATGAVVARAEGVSATAATPARREVRELVVLGRAGWEAKFVAAALEEQGWRVNARFRIAPGLAVGTVPALDTARIGAVIALDSTAADQGAAIAAYVRSGGGLVLAGEAARIPALAALAPGRPGPAVRAASSFAAAVAPVTRLTLAHSAVVGLRGDAVSLEQRRDTVLVAARRADAGRVLQSGYDETWRWRMAGADDSPDAHRAWWASLVESVAHAPLVAGAGPSHAGESAPRASLVAALGAASSAPEDAVSEPPFDPSRSLPVYIAAALLLLVEWGSRRLRGRL